MENKTLLNKLESINEQLNLVHYWIIFLKYKRILIIAPLLFATLGFLVSLQINPIFKSSATLVIEESAKNIINIQEVYEPGGVSRFGNSNYINNQIQILESDEVLGSILKDETVKVKLENMYEKLPSNFLFTNMKFLNFLKSEEKNNEKKDLKKLSNNELSSVGH